MAFGRLNVWLYVLALFLTGLGYLAIQPPFEGFDETAHYSSIRQIGDTGIIPSFGRAYLDAEITNYPGPKPYGSGNPPFDQGLTYRKFFQSTQLTESFLTNIRYKEDAATFSPSHDQNWEAQHPPLYYLLMAPIARALRHTSLPRRVFILRLTSFALVIAGVAFGLIAAQQLKSANDRTSALIGFLLYPIIFPMFFPEFARIGNDSLCLFLVGLTAWLMVKGQGDPGNIKVAVSLGVVLGAGLLTKAFFLPLIAAVVIFYWIAMARGGEASLKNCRGIVIAFVVALSVGGWWYIHSFLTHGTFIGDANSIHLKTHGGDVLPSLRHSNSLFEIGHGIAATIASYVWAGTWSLVRLPLSLEAPVVALAGLCFVAFFIQMKHRPANDLGWLVIWSLMLLGFGLFWHIVEGVALNGNAQTPGWYLHILVPWVAPSIGMGARFLLKGRRTRMITIILIIYAAFFQLMAVWAQISLFGGCSSKSDTKGYAFSTPWYCVDKAITIEHRLSILAYPGLAMIGYGGAMLCAFLLVVLARKPFRDPAIGTGN